MNERLRAGFAILVGANGPAHPDPSYDPTENLFAGLALGQREQRPARADLDVVGMRADGQDRQRPVGGDAQRQRFHE